MTVCLQFLQSDTLTPVVQQVLHGHRTTAQEPRLCLEKIKEMIGYLGTLLKLLKISQSLHIRQEKPT